MIASTALYSLAAMLLAATALAVPVATEGYTGAGGVAIVNYENEKRAEDEYVGAGGVSIINYEDS